MSRQLAIAAAASLFAMASFALFAPHLAATGGGGSTAGIGWEAQVPGAPDLPPLPTFID